MKHLNKPEYLVEVAKDVAKYEEISLMIIYEITYQNYLKFFGTMNERGKKIEHTLSDNFELSHPEVINESHMHSGPNTETHF